MTRATYVFALSHRDEVLFGQIGGEIKPLSANEIDPLSAYELLTLSLSNMLKSGDGSC